MLAETSESAAAYTGVRTRVTELLRTHLAAAETVVPATPEWTVKDLAAHLCGVCEDILAGRIEGVATDPWTEAQVQRHQNDDLATILDLWDDVGPQVEAIVPVFPQAPAAQMVFDATTHEHDLRGAIGAPGARDSDGIRVGMTFMFTSLDQMLRAKGGPAVEVRTGDVVWRAGDGDPSITLDTDAFTLFRSLGARRSEAQVCALPWHGDPSVLLTIFEASPLSMPTDDLVE